jgi:hypothetical protein
VLPNNTKLYWRVSAENESGAGPLSDVWSFTVIDSLAAPMLIAPADGSLVPAENITFLWHAVAASDGYELEVTGPGAGSGLTQNDTSAVKTLLPGEEYLWRARAWRGPLAGAWSEQWRFTTELTLPGVVTLLEPAANITIDTIPLLFRWTASGPRVDRYCFEYADDAQFTVNVISDCSLADTVSLTRVTGSLACDLWWRVRAGNAAGWGPWSEARPASRCDIDTTTGVGAAAVLLDSPELHPNYPNPVVSGATSISYSLPMAAEITLELRDLLGRRIALLDGGHRAAGAHRVSLEVAGLFPGQYFAVLRAAGIVRVRRLVIMR